MKELFSYQNKILTTISDRWVRSAFDTIDWNQRLFGIKGLLGVGKTTLLLQYLKFHYPEKEMALYVSADNPWFYESGLYELISDFEKLGGKLLIIDEIHKYPNWSQELKNIYDRYKKLKVVFTGSSLLHIFSGKADLSRRAVVYTMNGLSFREFLQIETGKEFESYTLTEIIKNHTSIAKKIVKEVKPLAFFDDYLLYGYYPFYLESKHSYHRKLMNTLTLMLEVDLPYLRHVEIKYIHHGPGSAMMIRLNILDDVGYLNEKYFLYGEEVEFCYRARRSGYKIAMNTNCIVRHPDPDEGRHMIDYQIINRTIICNFHNFV